MPRAENTEAVRAIEAWIELAGIAPSEPLRSITKGGEWRPAALAERVEDHQGQDWRAP